MTLQDNMRLYDIAVRLAVYVEDVKAWQVQQFALVLREVSEELTHLLGRVRHKTLDGLSKAQLNKLVLELRKSQLRIYSAYTQKLLDQLREFMQVDLEVNRRVWATAFNELMGEEGSEEEILSDDGALALLLLGSTAALFGISAVTNNSDRLWSALTNTPMSATGSYPLPFVKAFADSAQGGIENLIRKAWANGWTVEETITALIGDNDKKQGTPSQLHRIGNQGAAVIDTLMSHIAAAVAAGVISALFARYVWISVMDGRTSDICIERNRKVYQFGQGPLPPAHIRCRSTISPITGSSVVLPLAFFSWISQQPEDVQDDILGEDGGEALRNGELTENDLIKYESKKTLTYEQFRKKVSDILSR